MLRIDSLVFSYPDTDKQALSGINVDVAQGQLFGLLGPNGAGKTTLLSLLSGQFQCPKDCLFINGKDLSKHQAHGLSLVPQEYAFYEQLSVIENLRFFCKVQSIEKPLQQERIDDVVAITQLHDYLSSRAYQLSGGLKRRLNIAIGLLNKPSILLLDEPTVGIDPHSRRFILDAIKKLNSDGITVIYSTHYMEEVEYLCDEIAIVDHGKVIANGPLPQLLAEHGKPNISVRLKEPLKVEQQQSLEASIQALGNQLNNDLNIIIDKPCLITCAADALTMTVDDSPLSLYQMTALLQQAELDLGVSVEQLHYGTNNLEALFMQLTQRSLRD